MSRRASLPSADELFGGSDRQQRSEPTHGAGRDSEIDAALLAEVRRTAAAEDDRLVAAREDAGSSVSLPSPDVGSLLQWAAATTGARTAVEVGAAAGVTALWLLPALARGGVLTSIEPDQHVHGLATAALRGVGEDPKVRSILGEPATVLPRLSDASYDLVVVQVPPSACPDALVHARRLLRPGGTLVLRGALRQGEEAAALSRQIHDLFEDGGFHATVLPIDDGVVLATRLGDADA